MTRFFRVFQGQEDKINANIDFVSLTIAAAGLLTAWELNFNPLNILSTAVAAGLLAETLLHKTFDAPREDAVDNTRRLGA